MILPEVINQKYQSGSYLQYPEMEKTLKQTLLHPKKEIKISIHTFNEGQKSEKLFFKVIQKIRMILKKTLLKLKILFSKKYSKKHKAAIKKITQSYANQINTVHQLENKITSSKQMLNTVVSEIQSLKKIIKEAEIEKESAQKESDVFTSAIHLLSSSNSFFSFLKKQEISQLKSKILTLMPDYDFSNQNDENLKTQLANINKKISACSSKISMCHKKLHDNLEKKTALQTSLKPLFNDLKEAVGGYHKLIPFDKTIEEMDEGEKDKPSTFKTMIQQIYQHTESESLAKLWKCLLNNCPNIEEMITNWHCDVSGNFEITLKEPLRFWINTHQVKGGTIFLLGDENEKIITGQCTKDKIEFHQGLHTHCYQSFGLITKKVTPQITCISRKSEDTISFTGKMLNISKEKKHTMNEIKTEWEKKTTMIPSNYPGGFTKFLEEAYQNKR